MCIALEQPLDRLKFTCAMLVACWERGDDLNGPGVLDRIAEECGLGEKQLGAAAEQPEIKAKLLAATDAAVSAGIFGVPTFVYKQELFWGNDRVDALLWRLNHPDEDSAILQDFLQRGASAKRKQT
jgi:2-hydroxychromene-2-carboxylate isomerase